MKNTRGDVLFGLMAIGFYLQSAAAIAAENFVPSMVAFGVGMFMSWVSASEASERDP